MTNHKGYRNKTRKLYRKKVRDRGLGSIEKYLKDFNINDKVDVIGDPSEQKRGLPHRRFYGKTGAIIGQRGRCYLVKVKLGNSKKILILGREHFRLNSSSIQKIV